MSGYDLERILNCRDIKTHDEMDACCMSHARPLRFPCGRRVRACGGRKTCGALHNRRR